MLLFCTTCGVTLSTRQSTEAVALLDHITDTAAFEFATGTGYSFVRSPEGSINKSRVP
jgi:hypothetical protein